MTLFGALHSLRSFRRRLPWALNNSFPQGSAAALGRVETEPQSVRRAPAQVRGLEVSVRPIAVRRCCTLPVRNLIL